MTEQSPGTWSYRPGSWFGIFGSATTLLLPASEKARVGELWSRIDEGEGFDSVLDSLLQSGLGVLPGFVLVGGGDGGGDGPVNVLVRGGSVRVSVTAAGESMELDGAAKTTWVERTLHDVTALTVTVHGEEDADDLPIHEGLVRVSRVDKPAYTAPTDDVDDVPDGAPDAGQSDEPEIDVMFVVGLDDSAELLGESSAPVEEGTELMETLDEPSPLETEDDTAGVPDVGPPAPAVPPPPPPAPGPLAPDLPASPIWGPDPASDPPPAPPIPGDGTDHDGLTRTGVDADEFARSQPGIPGQPMAPNVTTPVARLVISGGETIEVDRVVLIGRAPEARRFTTTDQPRLVTVASPQHEISSTHVEVRPGSGADHGSAVVTDMGSTNGTVLVQPGLGPEDLKPGIAVQLIPGATINLGDGVTIEVAHP